MPKYIRLYEEYTELNEQGSEKHYSWGEILDTIQMKLPFIIIDFKTEADREKCIKEELFDEKYIKQTYYLKNVEADSSKYPSVFIFGEGSDLTNRVNGLNNRFDIIRLIIGEYGKDQPSLFVDGEQVDIGKNVKTSLDIKDMDIEDFYMINSKYYKFIG